MVTTELVSVDDYDARFQPAIRTKSPISSRNVEWFVVQFDWHLQSLFCRLLDCVGLKYQYFTFKQRQSRRYHRIHGKWDIDRAWLPGYVFVEFDVNLDFWQQVYDFPGFVRILGSGKNGNWPIPVSPEEFELFKERFVERVPSRDGGAKFAVGDIVSPLAGYYMNQVGVVIRVGKTWLTFMGYNFSRPTPVTMTFDKLRRVRIDA